MAEIKFAGVEIRHILEPIHKNKERNYANNTFVGNPSSNSIEYISSDGRVITFNSIVEPNDTSLLAEYRKLETDYTNRYGVLIGADDMNVNGNYYLTSYKEEKQLNGSYKVEWEFTEYVKPNIVETTFKRIGKSATKKTSKKKSSSSKKTSKKKTATYITSLLTDCGTLKYGQTGKKCVKYLQKFLQKKGYYKGYKIDGDYLKYTKQEVTKLQKAYKIKVTKSNKGQWDKVTRDYWRKKYNITSKKKKSKK